LTTQKICALIQTALIPFARGYNEVISGVGAIIFPNGKIWKNLSLTKTDKVIYNKTATQT
jgi:hypothetical protein